MGETVHVIIEGVSALCLLIIIQIQASNFIKQITKLIDRREKRIEALLKDIFVLHELIKDKLEVLQHKNREDLKQVVTEIISIITKKMK